MKMNKYLQGENENYEYEIVVEGNTLSIYLLRYTSGRKYIGFYEPDEYYIDCNYTDIIIKELQEIDTYRDFYEYLMSNYEFFTSEEGNYVSL